MKKILAIVLTSMLLNSSYILLGQISYYDAIELTQIMKKAHTTPNLPKSSDRVFQILEKYLPIEKQIGNYDTIEAYFNLNIDKGIDLNPFIEIGGSAKSASALNFTSILGGNLSSVGGLNATNLADGLAKFLVERVKEEMSMAFFNKFKEDLEQDKDLQILFPNSFNVLMTIDSDVYNYSAYLQMLQEAFQSDIKLLIPDLRKIIEDKRYAGYFNSNPQLKAIFLTGLIIADDIQHGVYPGEIVKDLANDGDSNLFKINPDLYGSVQIMNVFIQSLRSKEAGHYIVPLDSVNQYLFNDTMCLRMYLGLIYQESKKQKIKLNNEFFYQVLEDAYNKVNQTIDQMKDYIAIIQELENRNKIVQYDLTTIKEKNKNPDQQNRANYIDYYGFYDASLNLIEYASDIPALIGKTSIDYQDKDKYFFAARKLGVTYLDINEQKYASAILNIAILYDSIVAGNSGNRIYKNIIKYGNFMAVVSRAESSDEVKEAIETIALPAGSYQIKRVSPLNVSLNAYPGLYAGYEKINQVDKSVAINSFGVTAPIGFAISKGKSLLLINTKRKWSTSAFVSLIDIGAVAAFRFKNDSIAQVPTIQLKDIVSPGLFLSLGFPNFPISANIGTQVGPNLRKVGTQSNEYNNNLCWRFTLSFCVDIPMLNLYTKPED